MRATKLRYVPSVRPGPDRPTVYLATDRARPGSDPTASGVDIEGGAAPDPPRDVFVDTDGSRRAGAAARPGLDECLHVPPLPGIEWLMTHRHGIATIATERPATLCAAMNRPRTFDEFFEDERDRLFRALCLITGSRHEAEEIAQDAFIAALNKLLANRLTVGDGELYAMLRELQRIHFDNRYPNTRRKREASRR